MIDGVGVNGESCFQDGILRVAVDIDGGTGTDICLTGCDDYVPVRRTVFAENSVRDYTGKSAYGYEKTYVYEVMVPYQTLGLSGKPEKAAFAWAVKTPNETAYIYNRRNGIGQMEAQDWLWADRHYPQNPNEYYLLTSSGITPEYVFPTWTAWKDLKIRSDAQTRYDYRGWAKEDGLYLNMVQYVDSYAYGGVGGTWKDITHIELELWNGDVGNGWDGTYLAFFPDGSHYINNVSKVTDLRCRSTITDRGRGYSGGYRYEISYEIYVGFANNAGSKDGPYAFVQMMSLTPGESKKGYEKVVTITKDGDRTLWTDDCASYEFREAGIVAKDNTRESGNTTVSGNTPDDYQFPAWTPWEACTIRSDAPARYDYRGWAKEDGLYLNMVQYVDSYVNGGVDGSWKDITHIELELWNGDVGYGWDGTYLAFFPNGSHYINNVSKVTDLKHRCTITDRGSDYSGGYRYEISYEIYVGFANNAGSADGPYAFVKPMSLTPGESKKGYEKAATIIKDSGERILWTDDVKSVEFRESGAVGKDSKYNTAPFEAKVAQYRADWEERGRDGKTTLFIGDSFFDKDFWSGFYEMYEGMDVLQCGVGSSTSYDWESFTTSFLSKTAPKNIVIHLGTNNIYDDNDDTYRATNGLQKMFSYMHETLPSTKIYYFGISHRAYDSARIAIADEVNAAMEQWCAKRPWITYIGGTVGRLTSDKLRDGIHPREDSECNAYEIFVEELAKTDIEMEKRSEPVKPEEPEELLRIDFPSIADFAGIDKNLQSVDPDLYNFQMWTSENGYYGYFVQTLPTVTLDNSDPWKNTHVEMELWNGDVGFGWGGTYIALFPDETVYVNNLSNVRMVHLKVDKDETVSGKTTIKYYFYLEFDNNTMGYDSPYAYVKQYQFMPGVTPVNSQTVTRDDRLLVTGDEKSFQVHSTIDAKRYD